MTYQSNPILLYTTSNGSTDEDDWLFAFSDPILVYFSVALDNVKFLLFL